MYKEGVFFAIIVDDQLYFKVDDTNKKEYEKRGSKPFTYQASGRKRVSMSYWEVPAEILDDRQEVGRWAERSCEINRKLKNAPKKKISSKKI